MPLIYLNMLKQDNLLRVLVFLVLHIWDVTGILEFSKSLQDLYTIRTFQGVSIATCKLECESRQRCRSAIFYRNADFCILTSKNAFTNSTVVSKGAVLLSGFHTALDQNGSYSNCGGEICSLRETCTTKPQGNSLIHVCEITECPNPRRKLPNGIKVKGNIYTVGSKLRVESDLNMKTIQCESHGNWTTIGSTTEQFVLPTYGPELGNLLYVGARVVRGKDWIWGDQGDNGEGVITSLPTDLSTQWLSVSWDNGEKKIYRMGVSGAYDLMLVPGSYNPPTATP